MTDVELSLALWEALRPEAQVLFLGDIDQLDAVEAGGMLHALLHAAQQTPLDSLAAEQLHQRTHTAQEDVLRLHAAGQPNLTAAPALVHLPAQHAIGLIDSFRAKSSPWILELAQYFKPNATVNEGTSHGHAAAQTAQTNFY